MTSGRLTRQELGWLLAQEARGAAKILRQDVRLLTQPPPAPAEAPAALPDVRVQTTLNALDDAIGMLTELEAGPGSKGARRGRIDLAALLWELAPNASISIEPGAGTEVFGEEAELRRMMHVLFSQTNFARETRDAAAPVRMRREGEWVRITAELGPDISASTEIERRWLSRMATRMGGQLDLEGGTLSVLLPADASNDQSEVADLRKELEQAQQLGEAYARELATVIGTAPLAETQTVHDSNDVAARRFELLVGVAGALHRALLPVFRSIQTEVEHAGQAQGVDSALTQPVSAGYEIVGELGRIASCSPSEPVVDVDVTSALGSVVTQSEGRAARHGVRLVARVSPGMTLSTRPKTLGVLLRALVDHAVAATPRGGSVTLEASVDGQDVVVRVSDGGPAVPLPAHADLLEHRIDPASLGRPPGVALVAAHTLAGYLGGALALRDSPEGALVVEARLRNP